MGMLKCKILWKGPHKCILKLQCVRCTLAMYYSMEVCYLQIKCRIYNALSHKLYAEWWYHNPELQLTLTVAMGIAKTDGKGDTRTPVIAVRPFQNSLLSRFAQKRVLVFLISHQIHNVRGTTFSKSCLAERYCNACQVDNGSLYGLSFINSITCELDTLKLD